MMQLNASIHAVDSHTMGEPTRVVVGGVTVKGNSVAEKKRWLENERDEVRQALMLEPRGHDDMFGSILVQPEDSSADFGIIFMDGGGYLNMCGHGIIGATTVVIETGMKEVNGLQTEVVFETPAGLIRAQAKVKGSSVESVTFQNVPAFVEHERVTVFLPETGEITLDIAFGGSFFAIVSAQQLGITVQRSHTRQLIEQGMLLRRILNDKLTVQHPEKTYINTIDLVEIYDQPTNPQAHLKNAVIFGNGQVDRSPCGTGTCAKMALMHQQGSLQVGDSFIYESILGTLFQGKLTGTTTVGAKKAVIPEITGSAFITGFNHYVIDPADPLRHGFTLRN
jgi:proline racemase